MNNCTFSGNIGSEVKVKSYGETKVAEASLAVRRSRKDKRTNEYPTDWIFLRVVGYKAEQFASVVTKGARLTVAGELETYKRKDDTTGFNLFVEKFDFPEKRSQGANDNQSAPGNAGNGWQQQQQNNSDPFNGAPLDLNDDDLPF